MRAFWTATIVFCLLAVGGSRPTERDLELRDQHGARLDAARDAHVATALVRRAGALDTHLRPLVFITPVPAGDGAPPRVAIIADAGLLQSARFALLVTTRSSRGPPHG